MQETHRSSPRLIRINGYRVFEAETGVFKVVGDDGQIGSDFASLEDAASYARSLRSKDPLGYR